MFNLLAPQHHEQIVLLNVVPEEGKEAGFQTSPDDQSWAAIQSSTWLESSTSSGLQSARHCPNDAPVQMKVITTEELLVCTK